ncbi:FecR domain-containing protein [Chitinophaga filiformis]|uniref:FecR family protein n=1 Tax=Chitinophaga filiformis TaxID=104663 RepID=UPI001F15B679|nr:FecR domain-containing protein [Chitinophaga filiformis]MCF6406225.1 FecR domain-containing protein [Chitinophaga filiformis]
MALPTELYARFIKGECTEEEELIVLQYFREHPDEMESYLVEDGWETFRPEGKLHPAVLQKVFSNIQDDIEKRQRRITIWKRVAVAAALTGVMVLSGSLLFRKEMQQPVRSVAMKTPQSTAVWKVYNNNGRSVMQLILDDSSHVKLGAGSSLRYIARFEDDKRELWLDGKARFDVAKDGHRPFTVYAANTAVTALGTVFGVNAHRDKVTVHLYSGKVVVHPQKGKITFKEVYLHPGESLVYNDRTKGEPLVSKPAETSKQLPSGQEVASNSLVYHQQPLPQVLKQLEKHFNITITCDAHELRSIRVTAEFTTSDTPADILENIALLNGLIVERTAEGGFLLKK